MLLLEEVAFGSLDVIAPHLGVKSLKTVWGVNGHFQAKLVKYKQLHIIETTALIPTKFCTVINTNK